MSRYRYSANLGYLWTELPFLDRIRAAKAHGFDAVEFHDQAQSEDRNALRDVLADTGLPVLGLNVRMGETLGCAAMPDMSDQAKRDVDASVEVADDIGAGAIHVLAGVTSDAGAQRTYLSALNYALEQFDRTILIEPVSASQGPGFHLRTIQQAVDTLDEVDHTRLKIMFDCFHIHAEGGDIPALFKTHAARIGHVQIAAAEHRAEPFPGVLNYAELLPAFQAAGYDGAFGCEYRPASTVAEGLGWRDLI